MLTHLRRGLAWLVLLAALVAGICKKAPVAVEFDSASGAAQNSGAGPLTFTHTFTAGVENRVLVLSIGSVNGPTTPTYAGVSMTLVKAQDNGSPPGPNVRQRIYVMLNAPETGTVSIPVTGQAAARAVGYKNAMALASPVFANGNTTTPSLTVPVTSSLGMMHEAIAIRRSSSAPTYTPGAGQTDRGQSLSTFGTVFILEAVSTEPSAGASVVLDGTIAPAPQLWCHLGVEVLPPTDLRERAQVGAGL